MQIEMQRLFYIILLFGSVQASAQKNAPAANGLTFITPPGTPFGDLVRMKIGPNGGRLQSADGGLEVIFPPQATDSVLTVSIQATTNELNENEEGAYQLEPSGLLFKKAVQLIFHYHDSNTIDDLKGIAWQDKSGGWHQLRKPVTDTIQKTVSCTVPHFSRWARFNRIYLSPGATSVKVNKTRNLEVKVYKKPPNGEEDGDLLVAPRSANQATEDDDLLAPPASGEEDGDLLVPPPSDQFFTAGWTVNGIERGSSEVGFANKQGNTKAIYKAPAAVPENNPVAVSVQIYSNSRHRKLVLTSRVTVIGDQYHFTFIHIDENGCYFLVDSSSCILNMEKHQVTISNIKNYPPWSDWPTSCDGCHWEWTNKESLKGLVEIAGLASSQITPPSDAQDLTHVSLAFSPTVGNTPSARVTCARNGPIPVPSGTFPASPQHIDFEIDGNDVIIHAAGKTGRNELVIPGNKEKAIIYIYKLNP